MVVVASVRDEETAIRRSSFMRSVQVRELACRSSPRGVLSLFESHELDFIFFLFFYALLRHDPPPLAIAPPPPSHFRATLATNQFCI